MKRVHQLIVFVFSVSMVFGLAHGEKIQCSNAKISPYPINPTPGYDHDKFGISANCLVQEFSSFISCFDTEDDDDGDGTADYRAVPEWVAYEIKRFQKDLAGKYIKPPPTSDRPNKWYKDPDIAFVFNQPGVTSKRLDDRYCGIGRIIVETIPAQLMRERTLLQRLVDFAKNGGGIAYAGTLDDKITAHYDLGMKYANAEQYDDAIIEFSRVIELDYEDDSAHNWLGWIYRKLGQTEKGIHEHEIAVEINPTTKNLRYLAHIYVLVGEYDKAIDACNRGIKSANDKNTLSSLYNTRGAAYSSKKDWGKAKADYRAAIENNPNNKKAIENLKKVSPIK